VQTMFGLREQRLVADRTSGQPIPVVLT
jgi:hypothetical protein